MSIQPYVGPGRGGSETALVTFGGQELSQAELEKRQKDAEELEEKLKFITEKVPNRIVQVMGSNAGAGSGEFHMYRMARRRELMRLERMEEESKQRQLDEEFREKKQRLDAEEEAKTAKRRAKRLKQKAKKRAKAGRTDGVGGGVPGAAARASGSSDSEDDPGVVPLD
ncbi:hypothetical protein WJX81_001366 [Elliptochloris bilobata]|uniref:PRKR-interacting protein 1 n=1 Tax=Elliptochloris bilobata TaxID=381761 RepID=A0AAW1S9K9_9CHLO